MTQIILVDEVKGDVNNNYILKNHQPKSNLTYFILSTLAFGVLNFTGIQAKSFSSPFQITYYWLSKVRTNKRAMIEFIETILKKCFSEIYKCNEKLKSTESLKHKGAIIYTDCKKLCDSFSNTSSSSCN
jgi:hypothetical protein